MIPYSLTDDALHEH